MLLQLWLAPNWPKLSSCTQLCDSPFSSTLLPHLCIHCRTTSLGLSVGLSLPPLFLILVLKSQFDLAPKYAISFILRLYLSLRCVLFNHLVSVTSLFPRQDRHGSIQIFCMHWSLSLSGIDIPLQSALPFILVTLISSVIHLKPCLCFWGCLYWERLKGSCWRKGFSNIQIQSLIFVY